MTRTKDRAKSPKTQRRRAPRAEASGYPRRVDRAFLEALAAAIYDPSTRSALRLCPGVLVNGPDPEDPGRRMHCGLGELWFAMEGVEPSAMDADAVIDRAVELASPELTLAGELYMEGVMAAVKGLGLPQELEATVLVHLGDDPWRFTHAPDYAPEDDFRALLALIPIENDRNAPSEGRRDNRQTYRVRARRVASILRQAAALLPP